MGSSIGNPGAFREMPLIPFMGVPLGFFLLFGLRFGFIGFGWTGFWSAGFWSAGFWSAGFWSAGFDPGSLLRVLGLGRIII